MNRRPPAPDGSRLTMTDGDQPNQGGGLGVAQYRASRTAEPQGQPTERFE
ncbi:hypothetical protein [Natrinema sp. SYSU A 869]|nr:hypothetical protein [Natrinema sp. SYSU A 869]